MATSAKTDPSVSEHPGDMEATSWWNLWNTSHRTKEDNDPVSTELFTRAASVINSIEKSGGASVLEVACGSGTLSRKLLYAAYHGLDLSPAAIDIARQKAQQFSFPAGSTAPTYEAADFNAWSRQSRMFDVVVCVDAIAYFRDQLFVMKKFVDCLRPNGTLVLTTINPFVYDRIQRSAAVPLESGPVNQCLTRAQLHALANAAGLIIDRSYTIMPRGELRILRWVNSYRLNNAFGPRVASVLRRLKERAGLGQYRVIIARKRA